MLLDLQRSILLHHGILLQIQVVLLNDRGISQYLLLLLLDLGQGLFNFLNLFRIHWQASQLHLHNHRYRCHEDVAIHLFLLIGLHGRPVFVVHEPGTDRIHRVVTQQIWGGDLGNVVDFRLCPVSGKFLCLYFQTEFITGTGVSGQVGHQHDVFRIAAQVVDSRQHPFHILQTSHPQGIHQDRDIEGTVVPEDFPLVLFKEFP